MSSALESGLIRPSVSVLIPTYNNADYLPQAIDSVLAQTMKPLEIIVADDGSTDGTAEVVAKYGGAVRYRKFGHQGVYAIRQAMLEDLKGDWFLNLDADNWIEPDFLEKALAIIADHSGQEMFAFVYSDLRRFGAADSLLEAPEYDATLLKRGNYIDMNSLIRLDAARRAGFDTRFNDGQGDYDFFLTLSELGYVGARLSGGLMHYRVHEGSISFLGRKRFRHLVLAEKILQKHAGHFSEGEADILRRNAWRGMCHKMWQAVEEQFNVGEYGRAAMLGWRAAHAFLSRPNRSSVKDLSDSDFASAWREILDTVESETVKNPVELESSDPASMLLATLVSNCKRWGGKQVAVRKEWQASRLALVDIRKALADVRRERDAARKELAMLRESLSFKIGRAILFIPRQLHEWAARRNK